MEHSLDYHKQCLNDVCRICGELLATPKQKVKNPRKRLCVNSQSDILLIYGLNVKDDKDDMHSTYLCNKCYFAIRNIKKRQSVSSIQKARDTFHPMKLNGVPLIQPLNRTNAHHVDTERKYL